MSLPTKEVSHADVVDSFEDFDLNKSGSWSFIVALSVIVTLLIDIFRSDV